jgi:hypothetical protein
VFVDLVSYEQYNGIYYNYGEFNGKAVFYAPDATTPSYIYYNSTDTRWCLSETSGGTCVLFGPTGSSSLCPDLDEVLFDTVCPTPTPTASDCYGFDFTATFDCNVTSGSTPTPTPTPTVTPTPTITPSPTVVCNTKALSFSAVNYNFPGVTQTPSPTPSNLPKTVSVTGSSTFTSFSSTFTSTLSKLLVDCNDPFQYVVSDPVPFNTGATFSAIIDGNPVCVTYSADTFAPPTAKLDSIESGNLFNCYWCTPAYSPTPTPTPTVTPTPTTACPHLINEYVIPYINPNWIAFDNYAGSESIIISTNTSPVRTLSRYDSNLNLVDSVNLYTGGTAFTASINVNTVSNTLYVLANLLYTGSLRTYETSTLTYQSSLPLTGPNISSSVIDIPNNRLYVAYSDSTCYIDVIDTVSLTIVNQIGACYIDALTLVPSSGRLLAMSSINTQLHVIDITTTAYTQTLITPVDSTGSKNEMAYSDASDTIYISNYNNDEIKTFNQSTLLSGTSISVVGGPDTIIYNQLDGNLYVSMSNTNEIKVIDTLTNTVIKTISPSERAYEFAINTTQNSILGTQYSSQSVLKICGG